MIVLQNQLASVRINPVGSELCSFYDKSIKCEYIWQQGEFWKKSAPILFPIIGTLKNNSFMYEGKKYLLEKHGFAYKQNFEVAYLSETEVIFTLTSSEETKKKYPFDFELSIHWTLTEKTLHSDCTVKNTDQKDMFFSFGFHPAFTLCFDETQGIDSMSLCLEEDDQWISTAGVNSDATHYPRIKDYGKKELALTQTIFDEDAIICENLKSHSLIIKSCLHNHFVKTSWSNNLDILAVWSMPKAPFVCIEPWAGICDIENADGILQNKKGIRKLQANRSEVFSFTATIG
ncbi:MAG: aldose 1-epimerase family protein [Treponemataceae bacterium]